MVKLINLAFLTSLLLSCKHEQAPVKASPFDNGNLSFLLGKWEWTETETQRFNAVYHLKKVETDRSGSLTFSSDGYLLVDDNGTTTQYELHLSRVFTSGDDKMVVFTLNEETTPYTFTYTNQGSILHTNLDAMTVPALNCNDSQKNYDHVYVKN